MPTNSAATSAASIPSIGGVSGHAVELFSFTVWLTIDAGRAIRIRLRLAPSRWRDSPRLSGSGNDFARNRIEIA